MDPIERMRKSHIWLGVTSKCEEEFDEYFNQDDDICQFAKDIGEEEYDEDFMCITQVSKELIAVEEMLEQLVLSTADYDNVKRICQEKGINLVNGSFCYTDAQLEITDTDRKYNGLAYIGMFSSDF